ncbi:YNFM family putative membrane transporter [Thermosporothrix hazakensis]|jgi:YNFM family putative membrane transporter|uniref:YNFM family putative membrane transporter n=2 Tax=Thermosporothrix TaxID=768650 RepID=A0A326U8F8_THEHA|nr:MFS transporter [Thermosporothrix hazakensis]PZW31080.1 YNFM family putative membrane transporter [Thermosporothrix hazakensis]BBH86699.1 putative MFS-type transporter YybF [Thermosporothrix sp. COM3]GCE51005.1 putative MFS-type transporter YybF [Thermosporothrix hazakensis]
MEYIEKGTSAFRRVNVCFFIGGLVTFAVLYCTQPLLPRYTQEFGIPPATASLAVSVTTAMLAIMLTFAAAFSNALGRKRIMTISLFAAAVVTIACAFSPNFAYLLFFRALAGIVLAGLPAIAMAYLGEEIHPRHLGSAMGIYIGGNAVGGMSGRIVVSLITDVSSWRVALFCVGVLGLLCAWWFVKQLPESRHFVARPFIVREHFRGLASQLRNPSVLCLYGIAFLLMGCFVTLYSYLGYQLEEAPYHLSQGAIGWLFSIYIVGSFGSSWLGSLADRWSKLGVLVLSVAFVGIGALITLEMNLWLKLLGVAILTFGFFGGHAIASSWVSERAGSGKAYASALYLFFYYVGSSVGNTGGGFFWSSFGWNGVISEIGLFALVCLILTLVLPFVMSARSLERHAAPVGLPRPRNR